MTILVYGFDNVMNDYFYQIWEKQSDYPRHPSEDKWPVPVERLIEIMSEFGLRPDHPHLVAIQNNRPLPSR